MSDQLLGSVRRRIGQAGRGDLSAILADDALTEVDQLLESLVEPAGIRLDILAAAGTVHWLRGLVYRAHDPSKFEAAAGTGFAYLTPVYLCPQRLRSPGSRDAAVPQGFADELRETGMIEQVSDPAEAGVAGQVAAYGWSLVLVYLENRQLEVLGLAIEYLDEAAYRLADGNDPYRPEHLLRLSNALQIRLGNLRTAGADGDIGDLRRSTAALRTAYSDMTTEHPKRALVAAELGLAYGLTFLETRDQQAVRQARHFVERAEDLLPADPAIRKQTLGKIAEAIEILMVCGQDTSNVDAPVRLRERMRETTVPAHPPHREQEAHELASEANARLARHRQTAQPADARQAVRCFARAVEIVPDDRALWSLVVYGLARMLRVGSEARTVDGATLTESIRLLERAATVARGHPEHPRWLDELALAIHAESLRTEDPRTVHRLLETRRAALEATPRADPERTERVLALCYTLVLAALSEASDTDPDPLERYGAEVNTLLPSIPEDYPGRDRLVEVLSELGMRVSYRRIKGGLIGRSTSVSSRPALETGQWRYREFLHSGDEASLRAAVAQLRSAIGAGELNEGQHVEAHVDLSEALLHLAERFGEQTAWQEAIPLARAALANPRCKYTGRAIACRNLSRALAMKYQYDGDPAALDEAVSHAREDYELRYYEDDGITDFGRYGRLDDFAGMSNLVAVLSLRGRTDPSSLDEAVRIAEKAERDCPADHHERIAVEATLGTVLQKRHERTGDPADLRRAIELLRRAARWRSS